jgi:N-acetylmuramoyl-L-alanine amidase
VSRLPIKISLALLLALAGCTTPRNQTAPPDWGVASAPVFAPVATLTPATNRPPFTVPAPHSQLASLPPHFAETWVALTRWAQANHLAAPRKIAAAPLPVYALTTPHGKILVRGGSQLADWNGQEFHLGFKPGETNGELFIHNLDLQKNLQPLLENSPLPSPGNRTLVLDPGHGGGNTGTRSVHDGRLEKEFTLDWALRLQPLLERAGWRVLLTRTNDLELSLSNRVAFAEAQRADIFISLHFNSAAPDENPAGLETYCLTPNGMPSNLIRDGEDDARLKFNNNAYDEQNFQLALRVQRALLAANRQHDRGVRHARFIGVLRGQNRPAVLIEGGYLSNQGEAAQIAKPAFRQKLAEAVAEALR